MMNIQMILRQFQEIDMNQDNKGQPQQGGQGNAPAPQPSENPGQQTQQPSEKPGQKS
jgi:hypothetical protein